MSNLPLVSVLGASGVSVVLAALLWWKTSKLRATEARLKLVEEAAQVTEANMASMRAQMTKLLEVVRANQDREIAREQAAAKRVRDAVVRARSEGGAG